MLFRQCHLGQGRPNVSGLHGISGNRTQDVSDYSGCRGLSVRTRYSDDAAGREETKGCFDFAHNGYTILPRDRERRRIRRHTRTHDDEPRCTEAVPVVSSCLRRYSQGGKLLHRRGDLTGRCRIRCVNRVAVFPEELRHCPAASGETDDSYLAFIPARQVHRRDHRNFSVLSAMNAASTPRIQNRTTTWASSHPLTSKWW